ncbi:uncharacterized protein LOC116205813 isoform X1 [Punica granatum]|uniref:Uncharacterized protein LOC116205813 isoform X1 n=1 Tax=Punica granatum TaxID=22663 RepID=A0A6P8DAZ4_PUNGR|nr:uncharacterized protein LOC116205813 isoform X1 [Punica granatum]XP_031394337.1 uncharacterized protein LOC116205813 isoform X1 [Punica granatum]
MGGKYVGGVSAASFTDKGFEGDATFPVRLRLCGALQFSLCILASTFPGKTTKASNDQLLWELGLSCEAKREQLNNTKKSQERSENPEGRDSCTCPPLYRPRLSHMPSTPPAEIVGG